MEKIGTIRFEQGVDQPIVALTIGGKEVPLISVSMSQDGPNDIGTITLTTFMAVFDAEAPGLTGAGAQ